MEPGAQPAGASQDGEAEPQPQAPTQPLEGRGQVLLLSNSWPQEERFLTLQDILEQNPASGPTGPSSTGATCGHSSSSDCSRRRLKRSSDSSLKNTDCRAAKSRRFAQQLPPGRLKAEDLCECECECESAPASAETLRSPAAEDAAPGCQDAPQPREPPEPGARLLLVLCRASVLRSQLPRLQLLLQQVHARHRGPPAALVGIVVLPRREEEAEARRRMETLLGSAFAPHSPTVEVHTAVFSPSRPEGTLDIQRAAHGAHEVSTRGCVPFVDRETQTEGEELEGEGWERQAAADIPGLWGEASIQREAGVVPLVGASSTNTEGGLCLGPAGPGTGQVPNVMVPPLALPLTLFG